MVKHHVPMLQVLLWQCFYEETVVWEQVKVKIITLHFV